MAHTKNGHCRWATSCLNTTLTWRVAVEGGRHGQEHGGGDLQMRTAGGGWAREDDVTGERRQPAGRTARGREDATHPQATPAADVPRHATRGSSGRGNVPASRPMQGRPGPRAPHVARRRDAEAGPPCCATAVAREDALRAAWRRPYAGSAPPNWKPRVWPLVLTRGDGSGRRRILRGGAGSGRPAGRRDEGCRTPGLTRVWP
ncbi:unnamed protein product [Urochloa humidicola]